MTVNIAIIDDCAEDVGYLSTVVDDWADKRGINTLKSSFLNAEAFLFDGEDEYFDILLLDIEMGRMNGVELAKKLRRDGGDEQIIFITGYPDFISDGYDVSALHYLLKPFNRNKLFEVLDRAVARLRREPPTVLLSSGKETYTLKTDSIVYGESDGHYVLLHTRDEEIRLRMTVSELEETLGEGFCRPSRSFIVGLAHISRITKTDVVLDSGASVPLGKGMYDSVNLALIKYLREN